MVQRHRSHLRQRGAALIYLTAAITTLMMFTSLAVDWGRVQLAQSEAQRSADAAAMYAVSGLMTNTAVAKAQLVMLDPQNKVDGQLVPLQGGDVVIGNWNPALTPKFGPGRSPYNAVEVTVRRTAARNNAIPTLFAKTFGFSSKDVIAKAIAIEDGGYTASLNFHPRQGCLWLAGMPDGSVLGFAPERAPANSPVLFTGFPSPTGFRALRGGMRLHFSANGWTNLVAPTGQIDPVDGHWQPQPCYYGGSNGIGNVSAQYGSLTGVFLGPDRPDLTPAPDALDFNILTNDYLELWPELKQPFFIGDGVTASGDSHTIITPPGTTRLYLGVHDYINWTDEDGIVNLTITWPKYSQLVQ